MPASEWQAKGWWTRVHQDWGHQDSTSRKFWKTSNWEMPGWESVKQIQQPTGAAKYMDFVHIYQKCRLLEAVQAKWRNMEKVIDQRTNIWKVKLIKRKTFMIKHHSLTEQLEWRHDVPERRISGYVKSAYSIYYYSPNRERVYAQKDAGIRISVMIFRMEGFPPLTLGWMTQVL